MKNKLAIGLLIILSVFIISWIVWGFMCCFGNYVDNGYPLKKADKQFNRAHGTNNLNTFADYTETGLKTLSKYSGNEVWFFPTIETDMDSIKIDLQFIIDNARFASNTTEYGSDAYQEALDNAKEALSIQTGRLDKCHLLYAGFGKTYVGLVWGWIIILIFASLLIGTVSFIEWND